MELFEKKIDSKKIFDGKIVKLFVDTVELPNGQLATREIVRHPGAVCVLPLTDDGEVIMVRQFRYPFNEVMLEIPAGKLDSPDEDPLEAAKRELREETGAVAKKITYLGRIDPTPALINEKIYLYLAQGLTFGERELDDDEFLSVEAYELKDLVEMVMSGEIKDSKTQIAILKYDRMLSERQNSV